MLRYWMFLCCFLGYWLGAMNIASAVYKPAVPMKNVSSLIEKSRAFFEIGVGGSFRSFDTDDLYPMISANLIASWSSSFDIGVSIYPMDSKLVSRVLDNEIMINNMNFMSGMTVNSLYNLGIYQAFYERVWEDTPSFTVYPGVSFIVRHYVLTLNDQAASYWHLMPAAHLRIKQNLSSSWEVESSMDFSYMYGWYSDNRVRLSYKWVDSLYLGTEYRLLYTGVDSGVFKDYTTHHGIQLFLGHYFG